MEVSRRGFVAAGSAALGLSLTPATLLAALETTSKPVPANWSEVRKLFDLSSEWLHFSGFFIASHPRPVRDAIATYRKAIDANPYATVDEGIFGHDSLTGAVRHELATYLGGKPEDVALTSNTTSGLSLVYHGLPLAPGDEVLVTKHDHYVHHTAVQLACKRSGASMRKAALYDDAAKATAAGIVERVRREVRPNTRVLGITWVSSQSGLKMPVKQIAAAVADINKSRAPNERVLLVVDGVHGLGCVDETVADMGCDIFVAGTHKWMFAPRGTGLVWAKGDTWARMTPSFASFMEGEQFEAWAEEREVKTPANAARMSPGGFVAYEHQWAMAAAFRMHRDIGRAKIAARVTELNTKLKDALAKVYGVTVMTPRDPALSAGVVAFTVAGASTESVVKHLKAKRVIASSSPYVPSLPRLSAGIFNTPGEVEQAVDALKSLPKG